MLRCAAWVSCKVVERLDRSWYRRKKEMEGTVEVLVEGRKVMEGKRRWRSRKEEIVGCGLAGVKLRVKLGKWLYRCLVYGASHISPRQLIRHPQQGRRKATVAVNRASYSNYTVCGKLAACCTSKLFGDVVMSPLRYLSLQIKA